MARLADLVAAKEYLGVPRTECRYDLILLDVLDRASSVIEDHLGEPVLIAEREHSFEGRGCCAMNLPFRQVNSVENVVRIGGVGDSDEPLDPSAYKLARYSGGYKLLHAAAWEDGVMYAAVLSLGRAIVPGAVREAALRVAANVVAKSRIAGLGAGRLGVTQQGEVVAGTEPAAEGTYAIAAVTAADITAEVARLLAPYCRITYPF